VVYRADWNWKIVQGSIGPVLGAASKLLPAMAPAGASAPAHLHTTEPCAAQCTHPARTQRQELQPGWTICSPAVTGRHHREPAAQLRAPQKCCTPPTPAQVRTVTCKVGPQNVTCQKGLFSERESLSKEAAAASSRPQAAHCSVFLPSEQEPTFVRVSLQVCPCPLISS